MHRKAKYLEARSNGVVDRFLVGIMCDWMEEFHPHRDLFPEKPVTGFSLTDEESRTWAEYLDMNKRVSVFFYERQDVRKSDP